MKLSALLILQLVSLILIIAALVRSLTISLLKKMIILKLELWKWELMVLVLILISGRLVFGWEIRIVVFLFEIFFAVKTGFVFRLRVEKCSAEVYMVGSGSNCLAMHF
ncbi:Mechanosensitive ion channel family protein [Abeliophyllum distichum]|uniref:Mechanosensitive ion channel family protein n=1 Tax=Abeliophyllum distichum TaxID=126358 RepID=A0ABD1VAU0_9LAMI